jgi:hypothetical protein
MTRPEPEAGPTQAELEIGQAILNVVTGHTCEDAVRALSTCLGLLVGEHHHDASHDISAAELTLTRSAYLSRAVLRETWGRVSVATRN